MHFLDDVVGNTDGTTAKVLEWKGHRGKELALAENPVKGGKKAERTELVTTRIVSARPASACSGHQVLRRGRGVAVRAP